MSINIGTGISFWIMMIQVAISLAVLTKLGFVIYTYVKRQRWNKYGSLVTWFLITVFVLVVMFIGYGPGRVDLQSVTGDEIGMTKIQKEAGPENVDSVREVTKESEPEALKRQRDPGFEKEAKQADEYLRSLGIE